MPTSIDAITAIPAFSDNYFWLIRRGDQAAVVDPGDAAPVEAALARAGLRLAAIVLTHHHADHVGGVAALTRTRDIPVFGPRHEHIAGVTVALGDGDVAHVLDLDLRVIDVPGHTAGHIAYAGTVDGRAVLFCGDTLFACGCGRLFEGTAAQMHASLARLAALPGDSAVYCAHEYTLSNIAFARAVEPDNVALAEWAQRAAALRAQGLATVPTTIAHELRVNPFLRVDAPAVRRSVETHAPGTARDDVATFAALRAWKNDFR